MLVSLLLAALELIEVHGADGQVAYVNAQEISSLRAPLSSDLASHFTTGAQCIIVTTNGKFLATRESCSTLRDKLAKPGHE